MITAVRYSSTIPLPRLQPGYNVHYLSCQSPKRQFVSSFLGSALGSCPLRKLSRTKTLPYPSQAVFRAVSDVSGYPTFLPFTVSSTVTSKDQHGYPERAKLIVGYSKFGLEEEWDSLIHCDPEKGIVEARSSGQNSHGLFEVLEARWKIVTSQSNDRQSTVKLDVDVKFRNPVYDQVFSQVEQKVADRMISAFESRVQQLEEKQK